MVTAVERSNTQSISVGQSQEIVVKRRNDVGILFELSTLLSDRGVNILGVSAGVCGEECLIRLMTDDNRQAKDVLAANNFTPDEEDVVLVRLLHRPGTLKQVTKALAQEGIDLRHVYAAADREQDKCLLVFHSSNDESALAKLQELQVELSEDRQVDQERATNMVSEGDPNY